MILGTWTLIPESFLVYDSAMKTNKKLEINRYLARPAEKKPMDIISYINRMNSIYGSSEVDKYGNPPSATDRIQDPKFFQKKLKNVQKEPIKKAPVKIVKKPTVLELLEIEDWLNTIDPNYWIPEEKPKPKPEDKTRVIRTGITKLI